MPLERFSAAWRENYVANVAQSHAADDGTCVFCALAAAPVDESTGVIATSEIELRGPQRLSLRFRPPPGACRRVTWPISKTSVTPNTRTSLDGAPHRRGP